MKKSVKEEDVDKIIYNYTKLNMGLKAAGQEFGYAPKIVRRMLVEHKIPIKKSMKNRIYKVNDNYFDVQSSNMAYIMGFWASDGNVSDKENRLDLELASEDMEILEDIKREINSERPIKSYQCQSGYTKNKLLFWSSKIKKTFSEYGIVPNKTYSEDFRFPYKLNKKYWIDYIRGYFDGDGCITKNQYSIKFQIDCTNIKILQDMQKFFKEEYNIDTKITTCGKKGRNIDLYRIYCYSEEAKKIFDILYTENSLFLKRKYDKWIELLTWKHLI